MALDKVKEFFAGTELDGKIVELNQSSATVDLAAAAIGCEADRIAKTLSFLIEDKPLIIVVSGKSKIDNAKYRHKFETKAKMIPFDQVEDYIGHAPGGVCPFAVKDNVKVYLDQSLKRHETVFPAAGSENSAVKLTIPQLEKYSGYEAWVDVTKTAE